MHPIFEREWSFLSGVDETLDILGQFSRRDVGLAFGTYHFWEDDRLITRLKELVPWITSVQLSDWRDPPRCDNDRLLPGDGVIPLADIVGELEICGFRGCYEIEVWSRDLWKEEPHGLIRKAVDSFCRLPVAVLA
jgi:sugar phosphate isomerase/epimerase